MEKSMFYSSKTAAYYAYISDPMPIRIIRIRFFGNRNKIITRIMAFLKNPDPKIDKAIQIRGIFARMDFHMTQMAFFSNRISKSERIPCLWTESVIWQRVTQESSFVRITLIWVILISIQQLQNGWKIWLVWARCSTVQGGASCQVHSESRLLVRVPPRLTKPSTPPTLVNQYQTSMRRTKYWLLHRLATSIHCIGLKHIQVISWK